MWAAVADVIPETLTEYETVRPVCPISGSRTVTLAVAVADVPTGDGRTFAPARVAENRVPLPGPSPNSLSSSQATSNGTSTSASAERRVKRMCEAPAGSTCRLLLPRARERASARIGRAGVFRTLYGCIHRQASGRVGERWGHNAASFRTSGRFNSFPHT